MASCSTTGRAAAAHADPMQRPSLKSMAASSRFSGSVVSFGRPFQLPHGGRVASLTVRAKAAGDSSGDFDINPFGKKKEEDAAKKALQDMFSGKDDVLAAYDGPPGGGNTGGRGGGGDGWFGGFNFNDFGDNFMRRLKGLLSAIAAFALFGALIYVVSFWQQVFALFGLLFTKIFRLDAGQRSIQNAGAGNLEASLDDDKSDFGVMEQSVISKYGGDDAEDDVPAAAEVGEDDDDDL